MKTLTIKCDGSLEGLRLLLDVTIYLKEGKKLHLHHLWIKNKPEYYERYIGKVLDFTAMVETYGLEGKARLTNVYIKKYIKKDMTLKGLSYYNYCWNLQHKNAKVVQGSSHDVMGAVAFLKQQHGQISDNNIPYTSLLKFFKRNLVI